MLSSQGGSPFGFFDWFALLPSQRLRLAERRIFDGGLAIIAGGSGVNLVQLKVRYV